MTLALSARALTTFSVVRDTLGLSPNQDEPLITRLINAVSDAMVRVAGRQFHRVTGQVDYVRAFGGPKLWTPRAPIVSVTSLELLDSEGNVSYSYTSTDYSVESETGILYREGMWPSTGLDDGTIRGGIYPGSHKQGIKITYTAGWITRKQDEDDSLGTMDLPFDIEDACVRAVIDAYRTSPTPSNVKSEKLGDAAITYREAPPDILNAYARAVAQSYRRAL